MLTSDTGLQTPPDEQMIWRFMSLEKLLALIQTQCLFFAPLRLMKDPFEGHFPSSYRTWFLEQVGDQLISSGVAEADIYQFLRETQFVNCWHANTDDSAAMWSLYSGNAGVAVRARFATFRDCLASAKARVTLGMVRYLDFSQPVAATVSRTRITHIKRRSFQHENELRASIFSPHRIDDKPLPGLQVPIDCGKLINDIVVDPESPEWIAPVVQDVVKKYGFAFKVKKSDLYTLV